MQFILDRRGPCDERAADQRAGDGREKGDDRDQEEAAPVSHSPVPSNVDGASAAGVPNGAIDGAGSA